MTEQIDTSVEAVEKFATDAALYGAEINEPYYFRLARCLRALRAELTAANARADQARNAALEEAKMAAQITQKRLNSTYGQFLNNLHEGHRITINRIEALKTTTPAVDDATGCGKTAPWKCCHGYPNCTQRNPFCNYEVG